MWGTRLKKLIYSKKGKFLVNLFQNIAIVSCFTALMVLDLYTAVPLGSRPVQYVVNPFETSKVFEETSLFEKILRENAFQIIRYAVICNQFETDGKFDNDKPIDIERYVRRQESDLDTSVSSVPYRLEDLIKWGQYGVSYSANSTEAASKLEPSIQPEDTGKMKASMETDASVLIEVPNQSETVVSDEASVQVDTPASSNHLVNAELYLDERFLSLEGKSLSEYVTEEMSYMELSGYLEQAIKDISYNYYQYKEFEKLYKNQESNIYYYILLNNQNTGTVQYTNMENTEQVEQQIKGMGKYIYYDDKKLTHETNTKLLEQDFRNLLKEYDYTYSEDCVVMIGIDTTYANSDIFRSAYESFYMITPYSMILLFFIVINAVIAFLLLILNCNIAGHKNNVDGIALNAFDRLNTECFLVVWAVICSAIGIIEALLLKELYISGITYKQLCMAFGGSVFFFHASFLFFFLSFARRIKSNSLFNNSLIVKFIIFFCRLIKKLVHFMGNKIQEYLNSRSVIVRVWVPYLFFLLMNLFLVTFGSTGILIAIIIDIFIGSKIYGESKARREVVDGIKRITEGDLNYQVIPRKNYGEAYILAENVNNLGASIKTAVETSMKDERLKTDLITNVSHDIKTPLTSIINYVDLLKRENIEDEKVKSYIEILEAKSQRLKYLTEDLVEASKISSGNITLELEKINFVELVNQTAGEFSERFTLEGLFLVMDLPSEPVLIYADSRRIWRVIENLYNNIAKYSLPNTRVYIDLVTRIIDSKEFAVLSLKNISRSALNINAEELTERFIRGDVSRSTEGSGLGLSIAKDLTKMQGGNFEIYLDGDLFKTTITFPLAKN